MVVIGGLPEFQIDSGLTTPNKKSDHGRRSIRRPMAPKISAEPRHSYSVVRSRRVSFEPETSYRKRLGIFINPLFIIKKIKLP